MSFWWAAIGVLHAHNSLGVTQGHGQRRATCRCSQNTELFTVDIKDFQRILRPLQQGSQQFKMSVLRQVGLLLRHTGCVYVHA